LGSSGQVTCGIHVTGHEGGQGGGVSPGDLKLSGVTLGTKEKVGGDRVENQELGVEPLQARMEVSTPSLKRHATSTTQQQSPKYTDTAASRTNAPSSPVSSTASQMRSPVFMTSSMGAISTWSGRNSPSSSDISRTGIPSPPPLPMSTNTVETLVEYMSMMEHLPSGREVSPPAPGNSWMDWSHAWGGEMRLRKVLEKLNLEYPRDLAD
jgi:hypothetical protein